MPKVVQALALHRELQLTAFVPTATEWRRETLVLKDFCSKGLASIMIGFSILQ
jgi:hypothetical protein